MIINIQSFISSHEDKLDLAPSRNELIVKNGNELFLIPRACPHQGLPLTRATIHNGIMTCGWHGCQFVVSADLKEPAPRVLKCRQLEVKNGMVELPD